MDGPDARGALQKRHEIGGLPLDMYQLVSTLTKVSMRARAEALHSTPAPGAEVEVIESLPRKRIGRPNANDAQTAHCAVSAPQ